MDSFASEVIHTIKSLSKMHKKSGEYSMRLLYKSKKVVVICAKKWYNM